MKEKIDYGEITSKYSWIMEKNQKAILSPDSDGLLCGLLMSNFLNWEIVGYYDGKALLLKEGLTTKDCIFLDMDIFRENIRSLGHHMVMYNKNRIPTNWNNFSNCIQPNNIRGYDYSHDFKLKYPLGSIHLLLGIIGSKIEIEIPKSAICPLVYTDGVFKNLFNYPENCLSWLAFLEADNPKSPLHKIFYNEHYLVFDLMIALKEFFEKISLIGDGIKISNTKGEPINLIKENQNYFFEEEVKINVESFINLLSDLTKWNYKKDNWVWNKMNCYIFSKGSIKPTNKEYNELLNKNPLSLAITSRQEIQYTLEESNKLP